MIHVTSVASNFLVALSHPLEPYPSNWESFLVISCSGNISTKLSEEKQTTPFQQHLSSNQNPYDIPLYSLFNRDPDFMAYELIPI